MSLEHSEGGLQVDGFAVRPLTPPAGEEYPEQETFTESLWALGFDPGHTTIDIVCPEAETAAAPKNSDGRIRTGRMQFGVQFSKPTDRTARGAIIRVAYKSGGRTYVHRIGFELILCQGNNVEEEIAECNFYGSKHYHW